MTSKTLYVVSTSIFFSMCAPLAACPLEAAKKVEDVIAAKQEFKKPANGQVVRDLRTLRDAAVILEAYDHDTACSHVAAALEELTSSPERTLAAGDNDEAKADEVERARKAKPTRR